MSSVRVIVTDKCTRSCDYCANKKPNDAEEIGNILQLSGYDTIVITGGEPMLVPEKVLDICRFYGEKANVYMYTQHWHPMGWAIAEYLSGITFTIHDRFAIGALTAWEHVLKKRMDMTTRLNFMPTPDMSLVSFDTNLWDEMKHVKILEDCPYPEDKLMRWVI